MAKGKSKRTVHDMPFIYQELEREKYEALIKRAKFTFFFGASLFGASLSWLIANIAKLIYGAIPVYEAFVPLTLLVVGSVLVITYANIEFLVNDFHENQRASARH